MSFTPIKNASFEKARQMLGFEAQVELREGIEHTVVWYRSALASVGI